MDYFFIKLTQLFYSFKHEIHELYACVYILLLEFPIRIKELNLNKIIKKCLKVIINPKGQKNLNSFTVFYNFNIIQCKVDVCLILELIADSIENPPD